MKENEFLLTAVGQHGLGTKLRKYAANATQHCISF
jgi:hypothetical protein